MTAPKYLTTKEVAGLCRVSDATVKRWTDAGLLRTERTKGNHRRFRAEEVARFQREQSLGLKMHLGGDPVISTVRRRRNKFASSSALFDLLIAGCEESAAELIIGEHLRGRPLTRIFDALICPSMRRIGELWYQGELSVAQEHLATRTALYAAHKLRDSLPVPEPAGKLAFCCSFEADLHELPIHLAQMTVENAGWEVMNFGANTPLFSLHEEMHRSLPHLICISVTYLNDIERLARDYAEFYESAAELRIPVVLGGRLFREDCMRRRFPADFYADTFASVERFVNGSFD